MTTLLLADFFVVRRPLLAIDDFLTVQQRLVDGESLATVLLTVYEDSRCREALFYASPSVYTELIAWREGGPAPANKLLLTLYKYFVRMTTRSTPFGLFAGIALGTWGDNSEQHIESSIKRSVRLDSGVISELVALADRQPFIRHQLTYKPNESLVVADNTLCYVGYEEEDGLRTYFQNEVAVDNHLLQLIEETSEGISFEQILTALQNRAVPAEAATAYIHALIDNQILRSELGINVTGPDPLEMLVSRLSELTGTQLFVNRIRQVQALLKQDTLMAYQQIAGKLSEMVSVTRSSLVQCDVFFNADRPVMASTVRTALGHTLSDLASRSQSVAVPRLDAFKQRFFNRYEHQSIPLLVALNPDVGIGYDDEYEVPNAWLDGLPWIGPDQSSPSEERISEGLLRLYTNALSNRQSTIFLSTAELDTIFPIQEKRVFPASGYALGQLMGNTSDLEPLFLLKGMGGPSAANLLGRFAHLAPALEMQLKQHLADEQAAYEGVILAELVHLPATRTGNVLRRPVLRPYEIPILTRSATSGQQQLPLNDLMLSIADRQQLVLYSKRLGKQVIPRLSTAHNVAADSLAHYRFLYDLQHQNNSSRFGWNWSTLKKMPFLPRVQYQNVLLSRARWYLRREDVGEELTDKWTTWRRINQVPRFVAVAEGDNELVIDVESQEGFVLLRQVLRRDGHAILFEWVDQPTAATHGSSAKKQWSSELVIPLRAVHQQNRHRKLTVNPPIDGSVREFVPGSQWVYLKLYASPLFSDALLRESLPPLLSDLTTQGLLQSWFFIRYADPEKHVRIRFLAVADQSTSLFTSIHTWVNELIASTNRIHRIQFDTYQREIERFGVATIDLCEAWFCVDSQTVVDLLTLLDSQPDWQRLRVGCLFVHQLLDAWQYDPVAQCTLLEDWRGTFLIEFQADKSFLMEVNTLFRDYKQYLVEPSAEEQTLITLLRSFRVQASSLRTELELAEPNSSNRLLPHLIHLFLNRLFVDSQRRNELIVYCFLLKLVRLWPNLKRD